jgi:hypothetical protein
MLAAHNLGEIPMAKKARKKADKKLSKKPAKKSAAKTKKKPAAKKAKRAPKKKKPRRRVWAPKLPAPTAPSSTPSKAPTSSAIKWSSAARRSRNKIIPRFRGILKRDAMSGI